MKGKEIKKRLEDKSGYDKEIIEKEKKFDNKNKLVDNKLDIEVGGDVTAYGEFISSYFAWIPLSKQKRRAEELNEKNKNKKDANNQIRQNVIIKLAGRIILERLNKVKKSIKK